MNNYLAVYIERYVTYRIDNEDIMQQFQNMKYREKQLSNFIYFSFFIFYFLFFAMLIYSSSLLFKILYNLYFLLTPLKNNLEVATVVDY